MGIVNLFIIVCVITSYSIHYTKLYEPGGYIQIDVPKFKANFKDFEIEKQFRDDWEKYKMWGLGIKNTEETFRAYSMANYPAEKNLIKLNIRIATPPWRNNFV